MNDDEILLSWHANAEAWATAVGGGVIESRAAVTNDAIVQAIRRHSPLRVLDVGCGEGWLVRELVNRGTDTIGIDAVAELTGRAAALGAGSFETVSYEDLIAGRWTPPAPIDAAVCNFSLLGEGVVENLLRRLAVLLEQDGKLFVQTVHPATQTEPDGSPAADGWRRETWQGFGRGFERPAPWYFRGRDSWVRLFEACGYRLLEMEEPRRPGGHRADSLLFVCRVRAGQ